MRAHRVIANIYCQRISRELTCSLVRALLLDIDVGRLRVAEESQLGTELAEVKARDLLVELLGQHVHVAALVLARRALLPELELREGLVGEGRRHDEGRVARRAAQVEEAALGEEDDAVPVGEQVAVDLGLDVLALDARERLEAGDVNLVVEVADVADDRVVLHAGHVGDGDDVLVARRRDDNVDLREDRLHADDTEALHARLERADGVDLRDVDDAPGSLHRLSAPLADVAKATDESALASKHDVGSAHDTVRQRVLAAVQVVELGLGHRVVDVDGGDEERARLLHLVEAVDARSRLLRDSLATRNVLVPALGVLLELAGEDRQHEAELLIRRGGRVRDRAVLGEGLLRLVALVDEERHVAAVIDNDVGAETLAIVRRPGAAVQSALHRQTHKAS